jgi:sugar-specific transcriptional regulator TrmB
MSLERMLDTLESLGFTLAEAQTYVFLAKKGPCTRKELANVLGLTEHQLRPTLESLRTKGIANATCERNTLFSVVSIEKVLDIFMEATLKKAKAFQTNRDELLSNWRSMIESDSAKS